MPLTLTSQAISASQFQIIYLNFVYIFDSQIKSKGRDVVYKQDWSHFDSTAFTADFSAIDRDSQFENCNHDPNLCFNTFDLKVKALVDQHLPTVSKRQRKTQLKP